MSSDMQSTGRSLSAVLGELLRTGRITKEHFLRLLHEQPALLGDEAQDALSRIAGLQQSQQARDEVLRFSNVLARMRQDGVDTVMSDESRRVQHEWAGDRREARLQALRERFREWRRGPSTVQSTTDAVGALPSLSDRLDTLLALSASEQSLPHGRNLLAPSAPQPDTPAILFRGESGRFAQTLSAFARLPSATSSAAVDEVRSLCERLVRALDGKWSLPRSHAMGFLQHYGFPTEFIDATADPLVAASFACYLRIGEEGAFCVIPARGLAARGELVDLRYSKFAKRPHLQSAFGVHAEAFPDLKAASAIDGLGLQWLPFRLTEDDATRFEPRFELLDARSDELAGLIWLLLDNYAKFGDEAAALLAQRIDPAPFYAVIQSDGRATVVAADLGEGNVDGVADDAFRREHYRRWSDKFPLPEQTALPADLLGSIKDFKDLSSGDTIRILTPGILQLPE